MKVNWKVRFKNPVWVGAFISQLFIVAQIVLVGLNNIGVTDFQLTKEVEVWVLTLVNAIFIILASLGVIQDPVTEGVSDSQQALNYNEPK